MHARKPLREMQLTRIGMLGLVALVACAAPASKPVPAAWRGEVLTPPRARPSFVLQTTEGERFDFLRETSARTTLLFFGYTSCPDICPVHLANIAAVLRKLPAQKVRDVRVIFVTTDPKRDTPLRIRSWLDQFDRSFVGLVGSAAEVAAAQRAAGIEVAVGDTSKAEYSVAHAAVLLAYSRDDSAHLVYPFGVRQEDWATDLPRLINAWPAALDVRNAYVVAPAPDVAALYLDLVAQSGTYDTLLRITTDAARSARVHENETRGGLVVMRPVGVVPVRDTVRLARGGMHVMLDGLRRPLTVGDTVEVMLVFSKAGARLVRAPVRPVIE
jgi:protein SCO1/2